MESVREHRLQEQEDYSWNPKRIATAASRGFAFISASGSVSALRGLGLDLKLWWRTKNWSSLSLVPPTCGALYGVGLFSDGTVVACGVLGG